MTIPTIVTMFSELNPEALSVSCYVRELPDVLDTQLEKTVVGEAAHASHLKTERGAASAELWIDADRGVDTIVITAPESGTELARVQLAATEEAEDYNKAAADAGFPELKWA